MPVWLSRAAAFASCWIRGPDSAAVSITLTATSALQPAVPGAVDRAESPAPSRSPISNRLSTIVPFITPALSARKPRPSPFGHHCAVSSRFGRDLVNSCKLACGVDFPVKE